MIGSDEISISTQLRLNDRMISLEEASVNANAEAQLVIDPERPNSTGIVAVRFRDFQDGFCVLGRGRIVRLLPGSGTAWELTS